MGYYAENPWERPEPPRCIECDECMLSVHVPFGPDDWECRNPDCINCPERIVMDSLVELVDEVPPEPIAICPKCNGKGYHQTIYDPEKRPCYTCHETGALEPQTVGAATRAAFGMEPEDEAEQQAREIEADAEWLGLDAWNMPSYRERNWQAGYGDFGPM